MEQLPFYIGTIFVLITFVTVFLFWKASRYSGTAIGVILSWLVLQAAVSLSGFYHVTDGQPPRFTFLVAPPLVCITALFLSAKGRSFLDALDIRSLTLLHTVRIAVELGLYGLYLHKVAPEIITFEGRNYDILCGITAPLVYYFGFVKRKIGRKTMLAWNVACLLILANTVSTVVLSAPFPFQQFAFGQPMVAILYFPFVWLPCCIVPVVVLSHAAAIRQLLRLK